MDLFTIGFPTALSPASLFYCFSGVLLGTLVGVLPGLGPLTAISLLLPLTYYLEPTMAVVMLAGVYYGTEYGGSTTSILVNLPGESSAAVTCLDGHPMAMQGRAGVALFIVAMASFVGGALGILMLVFFTPVIARIAIGFGSLEYFAVMVFGLVAAATIGQGAPLKGIAMVVIGLLVGCVGTDVHSGVPRYTFGFLELYNGIDVAIVAMGLFGVTEVIASIDGQKHEKSVVPLRSMLPSWDDLRAAALPMLRGTGVGSLFGPLPGTGPTIAAFISYAVEKRVARDPSRFGKGAIEGIAAPEASNNAAVQTAFIPALSLGIPGSATMAVILGALMLHGITPGPRLMSNHPEVFWGLIASFSIGNIILVILNVPLIGIWVQLLRAPYKFLYPVILMLVCIGIYSISASVFDIWLALLFGVAGYGMRMLDLEPAPLLIGFVLGPMMEENFQRAMLLSRGDFLGLLFQRPVASTILALTALLLAWLCWSTLRHRMRH